MKSKGRSAAGSHAARKSGGAHSASRVRDILRRAAGKPVMARWVEVLEARTMLSTATPAHEGVLGTSAGDAANLMNVSAGASPLPSISSFQLSGNPLNQTAVNNWVGGHGAAWETAANWSTGIVPGLSDDVVINTAASNSITISSAVSINSLTLGGAAGGTQTLTVGGVGTLSVAADSSIAAGGILITSKTISGTGTLTVASGGQIQLKSGTLALPVANQGLISSLGSNDNISGALSTASGSTIHIEGSSSVGRAHLTVAASFTNSGTIELTDSSSSYGALLTLTAGTLTNAAGATINSMGGAGGTRTIAAEVNNQGAIKVDGPLTLQATGAKHVSSGTITLGTGDLTVTQSGAGASFTNTGDLSLGSGRTMSVTSGTLIYSGGTLTGPGTLSASSATVTLNSDLTNASAGLSFNSSAVNGPANLINAAGKTITLSATAINAPLDNEGTLNSRGGNDQITGPFTTGTSSTIHIEGNPSVGRAHLTFANGFTNNHLIELTDSGSSYGALLTVTVGVLVNAAGANINSLPGAGGARTVAAALSNLGDITSDGPLTI